MIVKDLISELQLLNQEAEIKSRVTIEIPSDLNIIGIGEDQLDNDNEPVKYYYVLPQF
ncbi:MAG: hypothetical protein ACI9AU_000549 [Bacteroidia bacterium]|jgi:hypothetical protein